LLYYKYTHVADPEAFVKWHKEICEQFGFKGRILIAHEGINGTIEGLVGHTEEYMRLMHEQDGVQTERGQHSFGDFSDMPFKTSPGTVDGTAFPKMKVKVRKEVVSLGLDRYGEEDIDPNKITGAYLEPEELKKWYESGEDFEIIDMRNDYEFKVGHFKNSVNPKMDNFRDLPKVLSESEQLQKIKKASEEGKKVVTVCTGGIRCEKASGYIMQKGFKNVYQLHGGMHKFMEKFPGEDFLGSLYVFDNREITDFATEKGIERPVVGKCDICQTTTEKYTNCANIECHLKMLCCEGCLADSIKEIKDLIIEERESGNETQAVALEKILQVAKGFVFCSDECRECVGMRAGKVVLV
ncbi:MAG: rhodanese-related sulfurtransferase, partial [Candidatus Pacebacteria bacterium]|nr:rhodanese-related sulfurtransferase [Candidatus Paceibacterota bacterium]